jgi:energy-coupling factor transport system permease protein
MAETTFFPLHFSAALMSLSVNDKLAVVLFFLVVALAAPPVVSFTAVLILLIIRVAAPGFRATPGSSTRQFSTVFLSIGALAVIMTVVNGLLLREGPRIEIGGVPLYKGGIEFGIRTSSRLLLIATTLLVFFGSTTIARLAAYLHAVGLPTQVVMTILLTVHFLSTLPERITRIFLAQEARGAAVRSRLDRRIRSFASVLSPLLLSGIVESIERGTALELRGYHSRTRLSFEEAETARLTVLTAVFLFLSLSVLVLAWVL